MADLSIISPEAVKVSFRDRDIELTPLKVGQIPAFARAIKPVAGALSEAAVTGTLNAGLIMEVMIQGESLVDSISIATGVPVAELNDSTADQLLVLAVAAIKVNADFFKGRLAPAIRAAAQTYREKQPESGAGPTP